MSTWPAHDANPDEAPVTHRNRQTLSMNFGSALVQSCMRLDDPNALLLEYTRAMMGFLLLNPNPASILMVGLGGGSIAKYCHQHLPHSHMTVVEINPEVIALRDEFMLPPDDERLTVVCADGVRFMAQCADQFDVILIDGFTAIGGGAHHLNIRVSGKNFRNTAAEETGIVHHQDLDSHTHS